MEDHQAFFILVCIICIGGMEDHQTLISNLILCICCMFTNYGDQVAGGPPGLHSVSKYQTYQIDNEDLVIVHTKHNENTTFK